MFYNKKLYKIESSETEECVWALFERELNDNEEIFFMDSINEKLDDSEFDDLEEDVQRALDIFFERYNNFGYILPRPPFKTILV